MPLLPAMLLQAQAGEGVVVAAQDVPHLVPAPDQSPAHLPTPSRPQLPDPVAPILEHEHSSAQPKTAAGFFPTTKDAPLGGDFHTSPPRSSHAPPACQPLGGEEDPITLTALSFVVSTLVQKLHSLEAELYDHKKLFKDVVGKLVKKRAALHKIWISAVAADSDIPSRNTSQVPAASPCAPTAGLSGTSKVPPASSAIPPGAFGVSPGPSGALVVPADSPKVPANV
nr:hypothetical protein [Tanacetum cinerariifolium]